MAGSGLWAGIEGPLHGCDRGAVRLKARRGRPRLVDGYDEGRLAHLEHVDALDGLLLQAWRGGGWVGRNEGGVGVEAREAAGGGGSPGDSAAMHPQRQALVHAHAHAHAPAPAPAPAHPHTRTHTHTHKNTHTHTGRQADTRTRTHTTTTKPAACNIPPTVHQVDDEHGDVAQPAAARAQVGERLVARCVDDQQAGQLHAKHARAAQLG